MKRTDIKALATHSVAELQTKLVATQSELTQLRLKKLTGKVTNLRQIARLADDVARIKTALSSLAPTIIDNTNQETAA